MSTRANVKITQNGGDTTIWLYHHHDGYPRGLGASMIETLREMGVGDDRRWFDAFTIATHLLKTDEPLYSGGECEKKNEFELTNAMHGDIEYLYTINIDTDGKVDFVCQPVEDHAIGLPIDMKGIEKEAKVYSQIPDIETARRFNSLSDKDRKNLVDEVLDFVIPEKQGEFLRRRLAK